MIAAEGLTPELVGRLIEGARAGSLVLTGLEYSCFLAHASPRAAVIVDQRPVVLGALPVHILGEPDTLTEWQESLRAGLLEGDLTSGDVERLWHYQEAPECPE